MYLRQWDSENPNVICFKKKKQSRVMSVTSNERRPLAVLRRAYESKQCGTSGQSTDKESMYVHKF